MSVTYRNAPLVELVAELRWGDAAAPMPDGQPPTVRITLPRQRDEEIFMQFAAVVSSKGYGRFERVVPPGMPIPSTQIACRFRPTDTNKEAPLYQLGNGVFTANALPPYQSWAEFSPVVEQGIECLIEGYRRAGQTAPNFHTAVVRYIDAFREDLTGGRKVSAFLNEVMGFDLEFPEAIVAVATDKALIRPTIQLMVPTAVGRMEISFAEGRHGNEPAMILDTSVLIAREIGPTVEKAMQALTDARQVIHNVFRGLTAPIHKLMEPMS